MSESFQRTRSWLRSQRTNAERRRRSRYKTDFSSLIILLSLYKLDLPLFRIFKSGESFFFNKAKLSAYILRKFCLRIRDRKRWFFFGRIFFWARAKFGVPGFGTFQIMPNDYLGYNSPSPWARPPVWFCYIFLSFWATIQECNESQNELLILIYC